MQEEFEAGDEAIKAVDAREKREAERRAAGEVDEDEEDAGGDAADAAKESTPEKPGKENQVRFTSASCVMLSVASVARSEACSTTLLFCLNNMHSGSRPSLMVQGGCECKRSVYYAVLTRKVRCPGISTLKDSPAADAAEDTLQAAEREEGELSPAPEAKPIETPQQAKRRAKMEEAKKAEVRQPVKPYP